MTDHPPDNTGAAEISRTLSVSDLVTTTAAICDGFLTQALAKIEKATPLIKEARQFRLALKSIPEIAGLLGCEEIYEDLLSAAGLSEKARSHLEKEELESVLGEVLRAIGKRSQRGWRDELVYRFLLTKGDALGGSMRNITGAFAGRRFSEAILHALDARGIKPAVRRSSNDREKIQEIEWKGRLLLFDKPPKFFGNNIDVILLGKLSRKTPTPDLLETQTAFVACGELKGGIDPAGADEHWKTARSALERIRASFPADRCPALFFCGAAIETAMAKEIVAQLKDGRLTRAANLTVPKQVGELADWLVAL